MNLKFKIYTLGKSSFYSFIILYGSIGNKEGLGHILFTATKAVESSIK